jgi:hypothetical protein
VDRLFRSSMAELEIAWRLYLVEVRLALLGGRYDNRNQCVSDIGKQERDMLTAWM